MSRRRVRIVSALAIVAFVISGIGSARAVSLAPQPNVDGLALTTASHTVLDDVALRNDSPRVERSEAARVVVERLAALSEHAALRVPAAMPMSLRGHPSRQPAPLSSAPSLGRAPPAAQ